MKSFFAILTATFLLRGYCKRPPNNQIRRDILSKEAIFLKTIEDVELKGKIISYKDNTTLALCSRNCLRDPDCETFNYRKSPMSACKIINGTVESTEIAAFPNEGWDYYAPQKKRELPCKLLKDGKNADTYSKTLYGRVLTTGNAGPLCDFNSDGGGWTLISHFDYRQAYNGYGYSLINDITNMAPMEIDRYVLSQPAFVQLYRLFNFRQVRFFCYWRIDGVILDLATADNEMGDWVLAHLLGLMANNPPPSCGSYYEVSPSSAYLGRNCAQWNGQKWMASSFYPENPFMNSYNGYYFSLNSGACDYTNHNNNNPNIFKIYVR